MRHQRIMSNLKARAWRGLLFLAMAMGLLLFGLAGTIEYWQAWAYLGVYFGGSLLILLYLMKRDPALLDRRMKGGPALKRKRPKGSSCFLRVSALLPFSWFLPLIGGCTGRTFLPASQFSAISLSRCGGSSSLSSSGKTASHQRRSRWCLVSVSS